MYGKCDAVRCLITEYGIDPASTAKVSYMMCFMIYYTSVCMRQRHTVISLCVCVCMCVCVYVCVCVYLYVRYLDLQDCCKLSAGKRIIAIKLYFKKSNSLRFFIQGLVL